MGRTTGNLAAISPSSSPKTTFRFDPPHETLRRVGPADNFAAVLDDFDAFADCGPPRAGAGRPDGGDRRRPRDPRRLAARHRLPRRGRGGAEGRALPPPLAASRRRRRRRARPRPRAAPAGGGPRPAPEAPRPPARPPVVAAAEPAPAIDDFDDFDPAILSNEWAVIPGDLPADDPDFAPEPDDDAPHEPWQDRLVFDFNVSETSPVVKGTWVTVGHVVSLIVDGWTWGDILRTHPELTEDDIRICLAYTVAQDDGEADA